MIWGIPIVIYLFLAGMAAGAFTVGALAALKGADSKKYQLANRLMVLVATGIGLVCLMVDAEAGFHHPLRFFLLVANLRSIMAWGVIFLTAFVIVDLASIIVLLRKGAAPKVLDAVGIVIAVCVALYTGVLLGVSEAFPLWNLGILPVLFLISAFSTGLAACSLIARCTGIALAESITSLHVWQTWLPLLELAVFAVLLALTNGAGEAGASTVASLVSGSFAPIMWAGFVVIGLLVPAVLARLGAKKPALGVVEAVFVLVGGFLLRYLIIAAALPISIPAFGF